MFIIRLGWVRAVSSFLLRYLVRIKRLAEQKAEFMWRKQGALLIQWN